MDLENDDGNRYTHIQKTDAEITFCIHRTFNAYTSVEFTEQLEQLFFPLWMIRANNCNYIFVTQLEFNGFAEKKNGKIKTNNKMKQTNKIHMQTNGFKLNE